MFLEFSERLLEELCKRDGHSAAVFCIGKDAGIRRKRDRADVIWLWVDRHTSAIAYRPELNCAGHVRSAVHCGNEFSAWVKGNPRKLKFAPDAKA